MSAYPGRDERGIKPGATPQAREAGRHASAAQADARALELAPIIAEMRVDGMTAPGAIAKALIARGIPTARGHKFWTYNPVRALLRRLDRLARGATVQEHQIDGEQSAACSSREKTDEGQGEHRHNRGAHKYQRQH
jgi:Recombinase